MTKFTLSDLPEESSRLVVEAAWRNSSPGSNLLERVLSGVDLEASDAAAIIEALGAEDTLIATSCEYLEEINLGGTAFASELSRRSSAISEVMNQVIALSEA